MIWNVWYEFEHDWICISFEEILQKHSIHQDKKSWKKGLGERMRGKREIEIHPEEDKSQES